VDTIEGKIDREVEWLLKGWEAVTKPLDEHHEKLLELDTLDAVRIAHERAETGAFECPEILPKNADHYGALEPTERAEDGS